MGVEAEIVLQPTCSKETDKDNMAGEFAVAMGHDDDRQKGRLRNLQHWTVNKLNSYKTTTWLLLLMVRRTKCGDRYWVGHTMQAEYKACTLQRKCEDNWRIYRSLE